MKRLNPCSKPPTPNMQMLGLSWGCGTRGLGCP